MSALARFVLLSIRKRKFLSQPVDLQSSMIIYRFQVLKNRVETFSGVNFHRERLVSSFFSNILLDCLLLVLTVKDGFS